QRGQGCPSHTNSQRNSPLWRCDESYTVYDLQGGQGVIEKSSPGPARGPHPQRQVPTPGESPAPAHLPRGPRTARPAPTHSLVFSVACAAYLAVAIGESLLAPLLPIVAEDLDLELSTAGLAVGLLAGSIAVGNVGGGYLLARR